MYCVKCGVELGDSEKKCPLCGTTVFHPEMEPPKGDGPYPPEEHIHKEVSRSGALFIVTVLTVLPIVICLLCDWRINGGIVWSGYVTGALLMCYIVIVLPLWFRRGNPVIFVPVDFVALGVTCCISIWLPVGVGSFPLLFRWWGRQVLLSRQWSSCCATCTVDTCLYSAGRLFFPAG